MKIIHLLLASALTGGAAMAQPPADPDTRASALVSQMTPAERNILLHGYFSRPNPVHSQPLPGAPWAAGYTPGIARLGIPALAETDASLGVAYINGKRAKDATALPSSLSLASSWDVRIAYAGSAAIAQDARASGMNVLLAGGVNLTREPRNGRNFEYLGEDPLLAGTLAGETIRAIQDQHVLSTVKHYALNAQETWQNQIAVDISESAARESDLLAFEIAIERGQPGAVMCAYNHFNGPYSCGSDFLLNQVLKQDWKFPGFVMSDWGANHATADALAGLDRESGEEFDSAVFFGPALAALDGKDPAYTARVTDMNRRILRSMIANHLFDDPPKPAQPDLARGAEAARQEAAAGTVLLKNNGVLPLLRGARKIAVIGGYANIGVMSGGGSSQVAPQSGPALSIPTTRAADDWQAMVLHPGAPVKAIMARAANGTNVTFDNGHYPAYAAAKAADADVAIVFVTQWTSEGMDVPDLSLPGNQDALVAAVAAANPHTIVVLETGGPVLMPWADKAAAILEAWYPGIRGADAIADILFGDVNPSGRLPITFPAALSQTPRPTLDGQMETDPSRLRVNYDIEGSDVGYRWYARQNLTPLFPFGHGLSYTSFKYDNLRVTGGDTLHVTFRVTNTGSRAGRDTPQVYLTSRAGKHLLRLVGWGNVELPAGTSQDVSVTADTRLLADWDAGRHGWSVPAGQYAVAVSRSATDPQLSDAATMTARMLPP